MVSWELSVHSKAMSTLMPPCSPEMTMGDSISAVLPRLRCLTKASIPPSYSRTTVVGSTPRASVSTSRTPEFRNASSRRRCSRVENVKSVIVKVLADGLKVTDVPFLPFDGPTT